MRAVTPQALQTLTASPRSARDSTSASASCRLRSAARLGMKRSIASVTRSDDTTLCPCSSASRRIAVRAMPSTAGGTRSMRASASGVQ